MYSLPGIEVLRPQPGVVIVECKSEHDLATRDEVADMFAALVAGNSVVVVDVTEAKFIDCSFLHNLSKAQRLARKRGGTVRLQTGTAPIVSRLLETTNFLAEIDHSSSRPQAGN
jgi:anti-anti-sigma factor